MFAGKAYLILGAPSPSSLDLVKDLIAGVHPWDKMPSVFYPAGQASEIAKTGTEPELADFVSYQQWSELPPLSKDDTVLSSHRDAKTHPLKLRRSRLGFKPPTYPSAASLPWSIAPSWKNRWSSSPGLRAASTLRIAFS